MGLASLVQQVVSQFTEGQERSPFSFEMGVYVFYFILFYFLLSLFNLI